MKFYSHPKPTHPKYADWPTIFKVRHSLLTQHLPCPLPTCDLKQTNPLWTIRPLQHLPHHPDQRHEFHLSPTFIKQSHSPQYMKNPYHTNDALLELFKNGYTQECSHSNTLNYGVLNNSRLIHNQSTEKMLMVSKGRYS